MCSYTCIRIYLLNYVSVEDEIANGMGVSDTPRQNVSTTTAEFSPATTVSLNEPNVTMTIGRFVDSFTQIIYIALKFFSKI